MSRAASFAFLAYVVRHVPEAGPAGKGAAFPNCRTVIFSVEKYSAFGGRLQTGSGVWGRRGRSREKRTESRALAQDSLVFFEGEEPPLLRCRCRFLRLRGEARKGVPAVPPQTPRIPQNQREPTGRQRATFSLYEGMFCFFRIAARGKTALDNES